MMIDDGTGPVGLTFPPSAFLFAHPPARPPPSWSQSSNDRTTAVISILRPHFLAIVHQRDDEEISVQEAAFRSTVLRYERHVFELCSTPTLVWRRTGDIVAGNKAFAKLVGVKAKTLQRVSWINPALHHCSRFADTCFSTPPGIQTVCV